MERVDKRKTRVVDKFVHIYNFNYEFPLFYSLLVYMRKEFARPLVRRCGGDDRERLCCDTDG